jgi:hypothetical protein
MICVALLRRVVAFEYGDGPSGKGKAKAGNNSRHGLKVTKIGEWETAINENGAIRRELLLIGS